ncbi:MAG: hypothetical protein JWM89_1835 [Acidimicrobiales bacterium]|nr:hypothetical protein [Acidimicrobiales bacterium]
MNAAAVAAEQPSTVRPHLTLVKPLSKADELRAAKRRIATLERQNARLRETQKARRTPRPNDTIDFLRGPVTRFIRRAGERVAIADIEELAELVALRQVLDESITTAVRGLRSEYSWSRIGQALGITKQSAQEKWGGKS